MLLKNVIAFYLRLSMSDGDFGKDNKDESNSIENQRLLLQTFIDLRDDIEGEIKEYVDDGYSGTNFDRPAFKRMIEDAKAGQIQMILVKDLSRIGRDYIGVGDYLEQIFPVLGVRFIAVNSNYDSDNYIGKTMGLEMSITNLVNSLYSKDLSKKQMTAQQTKWRQGISTAGRAPYGYIRENGCGGALRIDPVSSQYVRTIFKLAAEGWRTTQIADYLNQEHIPTPGQYRKLKHEKECSMRKVKDEEWMWDGMKVWTVLNNYTYTGAMVHGKTRPIHVGSKSRRNVPKNKWFIVEDVHPAIVSKEEFEEVQALRQKNNIEMMGRQDMGFSLRSKVECGNCGLRMGYDYGTETVLYCSHVVSAGRMSKCDRTRHSAKRVEGIVFYALQQQIKYLNQLLPEIEEKSGKQRQDFESIADGLERELNVLKAERIRQYEAYAGGVIGQAEYMKKKESLSGKIDHIRQKKERIEMLIRKGDDLCNEIGEVQEEAAGLSGFEQLTREIAETFVDKVVIYGKDRIEVKFLFDDLLERAGKFLEEKNSLEADRISETGC